MKRSVRTAAALAFALLIALSALSGCKAAPAAGSAGKTFTVGVLQFGSHPSLDNCYNGIAAVLGQDKNVTIDLQNGNFDSPTCDTIAKNMVAKSYDLIIAIATPAAVSAYAAASGAGIPVLFSAVSDPIAAGLVDSLETPGSACTGTSDVLDLTAQLDLITTLQPEVKSIGVLYTTSEANSVSQLKTLNELAVTRNLTIVSEGVQGAADIPQAAASLSAKVDCVNNFTDNNVVSNLQVLLEQANAAGIPVYGSEEEQVKNGCLASVSLDYVALGRVTGEMAVSILAGEDAAKMAVRSITDAVPVFNSDVLAAFNLTLPDAYKNAALVTTNVQ